MTEREFQAMVATAEPAQAEQQGPLRLSEGDIFALIGRLYAEAAVLRAELTNARAALADAQQKLQQAVDTKDAARVTQ